MTVRARSARLPYGELVAANRTPWRGVAVIDGDDTLWDTAWIFNEVRDECREFVRRAGLDEAEWDRRQRAIDLRSRELKGVYLGQFSQAAVHAFRELHREQGAEPKEHELRRLRNVAGRVYTMAPKPIAGADDALKELRAQRLRLVLLTKGDHWAQSQKVEESGLGHLVHMAIPVPEKPTGFYVGIMQVHGVAPHRVVGIGDSWNSDIKPVLMLGGSGVHTQAGSGATWGWDAKGPEADPEFSPDWHGRFRRTDSITGAPQHVRELLYNRRGTARRDGIS